MNGTESHHERDTLLGGSAVTVAVIIVGIIGGVYWDVLTIDGGALLMSSVLAAGTFAYVLLTFDMSRSMREEMRLQRQQLKLEQKPEVMEALESEALPLYNDVMNVKNSMAGTETVQIDEEWYPAYPYVPTKFEDPSTVPRLLQSPIDIDPSGAHAFYSTYQEYRQVYGNAVDELQRLILTELDSPPSDSTDLRELAMLALQLETDQIGSTGIAWESRRDDIIPLRREMPELMQKLGQLRNQVKRDGGELAVDLSGAINNTMQEFWIDGSQLEPESVLSEWSNDETGQTGVYIGELPHRPQFESVSSDSENGERENTDSSEMDGAEEQ